MREQDFRTHHAGFRKVCYKSQTFPNFVRKCVTKYRSTAKIYSLLFVLNEKYPNYNIQLIISEHESNRKIIKFIEKIYYTCINILQTFYQIKNKKVQRRKGKSTHGYKTVTLFRFVTHIYIYYYFVYIKKKTKKFINSFYLHILNFENISLLWSEAKKERVMRVSLSSSGETHSCMCVFETKVKRVD